MGMFDMVVIEYPLPEKAKGYKGWQTKELECELAEFLITKSGSLLLKKHPFFPVPESVDNEYSLIRNYTGELVLLGENEVMEYLYVYFDFKDGQVMGVKVEGVKVGDKYYSVSTLPEGKCRLDVCEVTKVTPTNVYILEDASGYQGRSAFKGRSYFRRDELKRFHTTAESAWQEYLEICDKWVRRRELTVDAILLSD